MDCIACLQTPSHPSTPSDPELPSLEEITQQKWGTEDARKLLTSLHEFFLWLPLGATWKHAIFNHAGCGQIDSIEDLAAVRLPIQDLHSGHLDGAVTCSVYSDPMMTRHVDLLQESIMDHLPSIFPQLVQVSRKRVPRNVLRALQHSQLQGPMPNISRMRSGRRKVVLQSLFGAAVRVCCREVAGTICASDNFSTYLFKVFRCFLAALAKEVEKRPDTPTIFTEADFCNFMQVRPH